MRGFPSRPGTDGGLGAVRVGWCWTLSFLVATFGPALRDLINSFNLASGFRKKPKGLFGTV